MKKMFFLSCLFIPITTHCMEQEQLTYAKIEHEVSKLDELLFNNKTWLGRCGYNDPITYLTIFRNPTHQYGYTEDNNTGDYYKGTLCHYKSKTLTNMHKLKTAQYEGYSGIGVITLATTIHYDEQRKIIRKLLKAGYVPTVKDRILALHLEQKTNHNLSNGRSDLLD